MFATGRAARELDPEDFYRQTALDGNCHAVLNLTVNALGNVFPCCAGIDQTDNYAFGNIRERSIEDIVDRLNRSALVRTIVFHGVASLLPLLERQGIDMGREYNGICHLCWSIFSRPDCVQAIQRELDLGTRRALTLAIQRLEARPESSDPTSPSEAL